MGGGLSSVAGAAQSAAPRSTLRVVGLGDAITDVELSLESGQLALLGVDADSSVELATVAEVQALLAQARKLAASSSEPVGVAGGSAANVVSALAQLGGGQASAALLSVVGADAAGAHYRGALQAAGVSPAGLATSPSAAPSALALSLLTPGGARARRFCAGAAAEAGSAGSADFAPAAQNLLRSAQLLHCEGASLRRGGALLSAIRLASSGGTVVSLELGEAARLPEAAAALRAALDTGAVDLVFASEAAASALGGMQQPAPGLSAADAGVSHLLRSCAAVCVTPGGAGSVTTRKDGERFSTPPARRGDAAGGGGGAVEDAAADDAHAAGFLWALLHGAPLPVCAATGAAAKAEALAARGGGRLGAFARRRLLSQWEAAAGADVAAAAAAELAPPPGLLASLGAWLFPEDAPGKEPAHDAASAASAARLARPATGASAGQLWGGEIDYSAAAEGGGGALVEAYNEKGERVMMRRTLSGRLLPAPAAAAGGGANPPPYADGAMHRSLSSRVAGTRGGMADSDSSASLAEAEAAAAGGCAAPQAGSPWAAWVAHYLGLGWLSSWVDSRALFAAPEQAPTRMRRSMSSRVMTARNLTRVGEGRDATRVWEQAPAADE